MFVKLPEVRRSACRRSGLSLAGCTYRDGGRWSFEAASNVFVSLTFAPALQLVGHRFWMATHPGDGDGVERTVEVSVAPAVEAVPCPLSAGGARRQ